MPKYKIGGSYGYAGTDWEDEIAADDIEEAEEIAKERALEHVEWWAKTIDDGVEEEDSTPSAS
jgi:hypothetical protein